MKCVRQSKLRHVFCEQLKKDRCYENIRVSSSSLDSHLCAVNPKYVAVILECGGGGGFAVIPIKQTGRQMVGAPIVGGHTAAVNDIAWDPFNDNVIASASEDCTIKLWDIPDGGLTTTLSDAITTLNHHSRRVILISWHSSTENLLVSCGGDNLIVVWNTVTASPSVVIDSVHEQVWSICWSWSGSDLLVSCRDRRLRILDARTGEIKDEADGHEASKTCLAIFLKDDRVLTTGMSKFSKRQCSIRSAGNLSEKIVSESMDESNGTLNIVYDPDLGIVYLCGRGDSVIRSFELTDEAPFLNYIATHNFSTSQRAIAMMPKHGCDIMSCEISRLFRVTANGTITDWSFVVPRKRSGVFQEDLFPETLSVKPAQSVDEWLEGKNAPPLLMSVKEFIDTNDNAATTRPQRKVQSTKNSHTGAKESAQSRESAKKVVSESERSIMSGMQLDITKLKKVLTCQNNRIMELEKCVETMRREMNHLQDGHRQEHGEEEEQQLQDSQEQEEEQQDSQEQEDGYHLQDSQREKNGTRNHGTNMQRGLA